MKKPVLWKALSLLLPLLPKAERLNLGLDLQGGMHLVLEVVTEKAIENTVDRLIAEVRRETEKDNIPVEQMTREGLDRIRIKLQAKEGLEGMRRILKNYSNLQQSGGTDSTELVLSLASGEAKRIQESAVRQSLETIRNRVDPEGRGWRRPTARTRRRRAATHRAPPPRGRSPQTGRT